MANIVGQIKSIVGNEGSGSNEYNENKFLKEALEKFEPLSVVYRRSHSSENAGKLVGPFFISKSQNIDYFDKLILEEENKFEGLGKNKQIFTYIKEDRAEEFIKINEKIRELDRKGILDPNIIRSESSWSEILRKDLGCIDALTDWRNDQEYLTYEQAKNKFFHGKKDYQGPENENLMSYTLDLRVPISPGDYFYLLETREEALKLEVKRLTAKVASEIGSDSFVAVRRSDDTLEGGFWKVTSITPEGVSLLLSDPKEEHGKYPGKVVAKREKLEEFLQINRIYKDLVESGHIGYTGTRTGREWRLLLEYLGCVDSDVINWANENENKDITTGQARAFYNYGKEDPANAIKKNRKLAEWTKITPDEFFDLNAQWIRKNNIQAELAKKK